jgi:hypothetical protein
VAIFNLPIAVRSFLHIGKGGAGYSRRKAVMGWMLNARRAGM